MTDTATETKKAKAISNIITTPEQDMALAAIMFRGMTQEQKREMVIHAQLVQVASAAFASIAELYEKLTGQSLGDDIALGRDGFFTDEDGQGNCDADDDDDTDEGEGEDEDAIDATAGEDDDEGDEAGMTPKQAVRSLRKFMKDNEYSQEYIAGKLKVTQGAVSTWLRNASLPRAKAVERIERLVTV